MKYSDFKVFFENVIVIFAVNFFQYSSISNRYGIGGGQRPKEWGNLAFSETFFGAESAEKLDLFEIFWEKLVLVTHFLALQATKILRNFGF